MHKFSCGAIRSDIKPNYHQIYPEFIRRVAKRHSLGSESYDSPEGKLLGGTQNWHNGGKAFFTQAYNHLMDHLLIWKENIESGADFELDDDLAAVGWGVEVLMWAQDQGMFEPAEEFEVVGRCMGDNFEETPAPLQDPYWEPELSDAQPENSSTTLTTPPYAFGWPEENNKDRITSVPLPGDFIGQDTPEPTLFERLFGKRAA